MAEGFGLATGPANPDDEEAGEEERPMAQARLYICPTLDWHRHVHLLGRSQAGRPEAGSRGELGLHLEVEAREWEAQKAKLEGAVLKDGSTVVDGEVFGAMESEGDTALGVWVFPGEVFGGDGGDGEGQEVWSLEGVKPGLMLFDV